VESSRRAFLKGAVASGFLWAAPAVMSVPTARATPARPRAPRELLCEEEAFPPIGPGKYRVGMCVRETTCNDFDPQSQLDSLCGRKTMGKCQMHHDCPGGTTCAHYPKEHHGVAFGQPNEPKPSPVRCRQGLIYCTSEVEVLEGGAIVCGCLCA
jgi:hypothetical protein